MNFILQTRAFQVAGVTKKAYTCFYHTVEKVLGLDKPISIQEMCIKLTCSDASELAQRLIDRYSIYLMQLSVARELHLTFKMS